MRVVKSARSLLARADRMLARMGAASPAPQLPSRARQAEIQTFLRTLDMRDDARAYLDIHMERISRTLTLVPPPLSTGGALELGTYMHMAPALAHLFGYRDVRGAYFGPPGTVESKAVTAGGREIFRCEVALFDAERDRFPYADATFDCVLCCELIEHLLHDPFFMLLECRRVLADGGALLLTTPNISSRTAIGRLLTCQGHPQLYSKYPDPKGEFAASEIPHVREFTAQELAAAVTLAGYRVETIFTEPIAGLEPYPFVEPLLAAYGFAGDLRGEQTYCIARKVAGAPVTRYPSFLYEGC